MTLPERLHHILLKLREGFDIELPDPAELEHSGEIEIRGETYTTRASVPLNDFSQETKFTIYLHTRKTEGVDHEHLFYFHFEGRREISSVYVKLDLVEGNVRQNVTLSSLPREIFVQMVERKLGRGAPRDRGMRDNRGRGAGRGGGKRPWGGRGMQRPPVPMLEDSDSM